MQTRRTNRNAAPAEASTDTLALVLAGGCGTRLGELTRSHSKPAIPFGGSYRNIDFTLSNCVNSGLRRIAVLTQYKSQSLMEHLHEAWGFLPRQLGEFIDAWPAQQRVHGEWYGGTADAVYQNIDLIRQLDPAYVLVLAGDHVYSMDYRPLIASHAQSGSDVTISCVEMPRRIANEYGVLQLADCGRVTCFVEKPRTEAAAGEAGEEVLVSMGIYVFRAGVLLDLLAREAQAGRPVRDFGQDLLPGLVREGRATGYRFRDRTGRRPGYWRDVGTIDAYWLAHMELVSPTPPLDVADPAWPVWTRPLRLPPARIVLSPDAPAGAVSNAILSPGCIVTNAVVRSSVLSPGVVVEPAAVVEESVLLPGVVVERGAHVRRAIVDSGIRIPAGAVVGDCAPAEEPFRARGSRVSLVHAPPATMALRLALDTHAAA